MMFTNSTLCSHNKHLSLTQRFSVFLPVCPGPLAFPERNRQFRCTALMLKATILLRTASKSGPSCSKGGCTDSAIHRIPTQWINIRETYCVIHWLEIYQVDSAIHLLNNWDQVKRIRIRIFQTFSCHSPLQKREGN